MGIIEAILHEVATKGYRQGFLEGYRIGLKLRAPMLPKDFPNQDLSPEEIAKRVTIPPECFHEIIEDLRKQGKFPF